MVNAIKKIILITGLISGFVIPTFSQLNCNLKIDTTSRKLSIHAYQKPFNFGMINNNENQQSRSFDDHLLFKKFPTSKSNFSQDSVRKIEKKTQSSDHMPCVNPEGFFPMQVYKPDSTVRYSMRVEKIK